MQRPDALLLPSISTFRFLYPQPRLLLWRLYLPAVREVTSSNFSPRVTFCCFNLQIHSTLSSNSVSLSWENTFFYSVKWKKSITNERCRKPRPKRTGCDGALRGWILAHVPLLDALWGAPTPNEEGMSTPLMFPFLTGLRRRTIESTKTEVGRWGLESFSSLIVSLFCALCLTALPGFSGRQKVSSHPACPDQSTAKRCQTAGMLCLLPSVHVSLPFPLSFFFPYFICMHVLPALMFASHAFLVSMGTRRGCWIP